MTTSYVKYSKTSTHLVLKIVGNFHKKSLLHCRCRAKPVINIVDMDAELKEYLNSSRASKHTSDD